MHKMSTMPVIHANLLSFLTSLLIISMINFCMNMNIEHLFTIFSMKLCIVVLL